MVACRYCTDHIAFAYNIVSVARNGVSLKLYAHYLAAYALGLLCGNGFLAYEFRLVQLAEHAQTCHDRAYVFAQFVAVEWQANLEAQCVAATKSAGLAASALNQLVPVFCYKFGGAIYLKAVFASISRAADNNLLAVNVYLLDV